MKKSQPAARYIVFTAMGFELVGLILVCLWFGHFLDERYGWKGLGLIAFSILGLVGWFVHLLQMLKMVEKQDETDTPSSDETPQ